MKVEAALLREHQAPLSIETIELDSPRPDEVLVRLVATGICHTDIMMTRGFPIPVPTPFVLGHEGAGVIEAAGAAVTGLAPGDHVVLSFDHCGACGNCQAGHAAYCETFFVNFSGRRRDGTPTMQEGGAPVGANFFGQSSFATYAVTRAANVVKVDKDLDLRLLGPLACGIQTGAGAVMNVLRPPVGATVAVFGAGAVGLSAVMAARVMGAATIIAVDLHAARLDLARDIGATHVIDAGVDDPVEGIRALTGGKGVDYSVEASGAPPAIAAAIGALAVRGTCGIVGGGPPVMLNVPELMQGGRTVTGIGMGDAVPMLMIPRLIALFRQGRFPFDRLIRFFPFDRLNDAMAASSSGDAIKPVVEM